MYRLRELERKDLAEINKWRNDPELIQFLGAPFRYINLDVDERWFDGYMLNRGSTIRCAIVTEGNDEVLGLVSLTDINTVNLSATLHIMIGKQENQGKGIGTFAVNSILYHAFYNLNLHRVELDVLENNTRAISLYEKVGFIKEGIKRQAVFKSGSYVNMVCYGILKEEYRG